MYCTISDIEEQITNKIVAQCSNDLDPSVINETIVNNIISQISELIDDYLRDRYHLPLYNTHETIKNACVVLSAYNLQARRGKVSDFWQKQNDSMIQTLKDIQKGVITLDEGTVEDRPVKYAVSQRTQIYTQELLSKF